MRRVGGGIGADRVLFWNPARRALTRRSRLYFQRQVSHVLPDEIRSIREASSLPVTAGSVAAVDHAVETPSLADGVAA
jgi:hypothetical protein